MKRNVKRSIKRYTYVRNGKRVFVPDHNRHYMVGRTMKSFGANPPSYRKKGKSMARRDAYVAKKAAEKTKIAEKKKAIGQTEYAFKKAAEARQLQKIAKSATKIKQGQLDATARKDFGLPKAGPVLPSKTLPLDNDDISVLNKELTKLESEKKILNNYLTTQKKILKEIDRKSQGKIKSISDIDTRIAEIGDQKIKSVITPITKTQLEKLNTELLMLQNEKKKIEESEDYKKYKDNAVTELDSTERKIRGILSHLAAGTKQVIPFSTTVELTDSMKKNLEKKFTELNKEEKKLEEQIKNADLREKKDLEKELKDVISHKDSILKSLENKKVMGVKWKNALELIPGYHGTLLTLEQVKKAEEEKKLMDAQRAESVRRMMQKQAKEAKKNPPVLNRLIKQFDKLQAEYSLTDDLGQKVIIKRKLKDISEKMKGVQDKIARGEFKEKGPKLSKEQKDIQKAELKKINKKIGVLESKAAGYLHDTKKKANKDERKGITEAQKQRSAKLYADVSKQIDALFLRKQEIEEGKNLPAKKVIDLKALTKKIERLVSDAPVLSIPKIDQSIFVGLDKNEKKELQKEIDMERSKLVEKHNKALKAHKQAVFSTLTKEEDDWLQEYLKGPVDLNTGYARFINLLKGEGKLLSKEKFKVKKSIVGKPQVEVVYKTFDDNGKEKYMLALITEDQYKEENKLKGDARTFLGKRAERKWRKDEGKEVPKAPKSPKPKKSKKGSKKSKKSSKKSKKK